MVLQLLRFLLLFQGAFFVCSSNFTEEVCQRQICCADSCGNRRCFVFVKVQYTFCIKSILFGQRRQNGFNREMSHDTANRETYGVLSSKSLVFLSSCHLHYYYICINTERDLQSDRADCKWKVTEALERDCGWLDTLQRGLCVYPTDRFNRRKFPNLKTLA